MQSHQAADMSVVKTDMANQSKPKLSASHKSWLKWASLGLVSFINGYATILMYARGEYAFALLTLVLTSLGVYIFARKQTYAHRYIFPGVAGMILFIIFPLLYTIGLSFTNYSGSNQLNLERAQNVLMQRTYQSGDSYNFSLYEQNGNFSIALKDGEQWYSTDFYDLKALPTDEDVALRPVDTPAGEQAPLKTVIQNRTGISGLVLATPGGTELKMSGLRQFAEIQPLYVLQEDGETLYNTREDKTLKPNYEIGFYQQVDDNGNFVGEPIAPGFIVNIGMDNFARIMSDPGIQQPFFKIFIWTVIFSALTVVLTLAVGVILAQIVSWEALKGRGVYRVLLILPYAVPAFISILIFKGLFNQSFGEINQLLQGLFGLSPAWFTDPFLAKTMIIIVNTWLGYPYMMILAMGMLKAIPDDLYEASAMDGAGPLDNFFKITLPLLVKPMIPLLIASFAFNFNNFVLIQLLTNGAPDMIGTSVPAGHTDLLVSYTYRIAFEGAGGQDFGLAGAIATIIFLLVGGLSLLNMKFTKLESE